jgi:hypothetical protein
LPSIYVIEGLGQCCNLVIIISALEKGLIETGLKIKSIDDVLRGLMYDRHDVITRTLMGILDTRLMETYSNVEFLGSADVEITGYVKHGQKISCDVVQNQAYGSLFHSMVRAFVAGNPVAHGTLVSAARKD